MKFGFVFTVFVYKPIKETNNYYQAEKVLI